MKTLLLIVLAIPFTLSLSAQTTVILKNGDVITGEITQQTSEKVTVRTGADVFLKYDMSEVEMISKDKIEPQETKLGWRPWFSLELSTAIHLGGTQTAKNTEFIPETIVKDKMPSLPPTGLVKFFAGSTNRGLTIGAGLGFGYQKSGYSESPSDTSSFYNLVVQGVETNFYDPTLFLRFKNQYQVTFDFKTRYNLLKDRKILPYVEFEGGYFGTFIPDFEVMASVFPPLTVPSRVQTVTLHGFTLNPSVGITVFSNKKTGLDISAGYRLSWRKTRSPRFNFDEQIESGFEQIYPDGGPFLDEYGNISQGQGQFYSFEEYGYFLERLWSYEDLYHQVTVKMAVSF